MRQLKSQKQKTMSKGQLIPYIDVYQKAFQNQALRWKDKRKCHIFKIFNAYMEFELRIWYVYLKNKVVAILSGSLCNCSETQNSIDWRQKGILGAFIQSQCKRIGYTSVAVSLQSIYNFTTRKLNIALAAIAIYGQQTVQFRYSWNAIRLYSQHYSVTKTFWDWFFSTLRGVNVVN